MALVSRNYLAYRIDYAALISITGVGGVAANIEFVSMDDIGVIIQKKPVESAGPGSSIRVTTAWHRKPWSELTAQLTAIGIDNSNKIERVAYDPAGLTATFFLKENKTGG